MSNTSQAVTQSGFWDCTCMCVYTVQCGPDTMRHDHLKGKEYITKEAPLHQRLTTESWEKDSPIPYNNNYRKVFFGSRYRNIAKTFLHWHTWLVSSSVFYFWTVLECLFEWNSEISSIHTDMTAQYQSYTGAGRLTQINRIQTAVVQSLFHINGALSMTSELSKEIVGSLSFISPLKLLKIKKVLWSGSWPLRLIAEPWWYHVTYCRDRIQNNERKGHWGVRVQRLKRADRTVLKWYEVTPGILIFSKTYVNIL